MLKPNENLLSSIITQSMRITGNLESDHLIVVEGSIQGNVTTKDNIETFIESKIVGNIQANAAMLGGKVIGNIQCEKTISVDSNTLVEGDLVAHEITIAGFVEGNVTAHESLKLKENAVVKGNIKCAIVSIDAGARIDGNFQMVPSSKPKYVEEAEEPLEEEMIEA